MDLKLYWQKFVKSFIEQQGYTLALEGLLNTAIIAVLGLLIGIFVGTILSIIKIIPVNNFLFKILKKLADAYIAIFRGTPIVVQLLISYYVLRPLLGLNLIPSLIVAVFIFGLNSGAYVSEIMRGGILSIDNGQMEAGRTLGFTYWQSMKLIVLPQAVKNILPTLGNEFIALIKETSVVSLITVMDLTNSFKVIASSNYEYMIPYVMLAVIYFVLVYMISLFVKHLERRLRQSDKN